MHNPVRDMKPLVAAAEMVTEGRRKLGVAKTVVRRRERELDDAIIAFKEAGGSHAELGRLLGVNRSNAQARFKRAAALNDAELPHGERDDGEVDESE